MSLKQFKVKSYNEVSAVDDFLHFISDVFDVTFSEGEIPPILQFDLWKKDLEDFVDSTLDGSDDWDFTV